jgi:hypothetical protein
MKAAIVSEIGHARRCGASPVAAVVKAVARS